jgi:hypothetical protein
MSFDEETLQTFSFLQWDKIEEWLDFVWFLP